MTIIILHCNRIDVLILYRRNNIRKYDRRFVDLRDTPLVEKVSRIVRFNRLSSKYRNYIVQQLNIAVNDISARLI